MHLPWRNWLGSINYISFKFVAIFSAFIFPIALTINHILNSIKFFFVFHYFFDSLLFQKFFVSETKYKAEFHGLGRDGSGLCGPLNLLGCKINFSLNIEQMNFRFSWFSSGQCFAPLINNCFLFNIFFFPFFHFLLDFFTELFKYDQLIS